MKVFTHQFIDLPYHIDSTDTEAGRFYTTPSGVYPSVTTVLKRHSEEGIAAWRARVGDHEADAVMRRASRHGTVFHTLAEQYLRNSYTPPTNLFTRQIITAALPTLDRIDNIRCLEGGLYSDHLRMAGRVDCVAEFDGRLSIIDFKTSRDIKHESYIQHYYMQAAAYAIMWEERTGQPITSLRILMTSSAGETKVFSARRDDHVKNLLHYRNLFEHSIAPHADL